MSVSTAKKMSIKPFPKHYDVRISVEEFGPIEKGFVDLRPLTIFVGPSNTGKTYLAILIYALHKTLQGFPRLPGMEHYFFMQEELETITSGEIKRLAGKIDDFEASLNFSDLPKLIRKAVQGYLENPKFLADDLQNELERCFDLDSITGLIRMTEESSSANLSISIKEENFDLWEFLMEMSTSEIKSKGKIHDVEIFSKEKFNSNADYKRRTSRLRRILRNVARSSQGRHLSFLLGEVWETLLNHTEERQVETYYLPAARSGIMQSHRVIASSLVARSTRAGLERFPELPTFSGVMADFMQRLILYDMPVRQGQRRISAIKSLAEALERRTLGGQIRTRRSSPGAYPEFVYRPLEAKQDIRLSRASSMVSELAPVVLFIRGNIGSGDTLIIEEPEAHLHPAAQTEMAAILASLVRCGVRVVVTTHSDWLLKAIGNLMREGEIEDRAGKLLSQNLSPSPLRPQDVGIWLFRKDEAAKGSTIEEIEFDRIEGIEPSDYESVAEQLYNRSADLQNLLQEIVSQQVRKP